MADATRLPISAELVLRVDAESSAGYGVALAWKDTVVARNAVPVAVQVFAGMPVWFRSPYQHCRLLAGELAAQGEIRLGTARIVVEDTYRAAADRLYLDRVITVHGSEPGSGFLSASEWHQPAADDDPRFIPGVWYGRNEYVPANAVGSPAQRARGGCMMLREDRLPLPLLMRYNQEQQFFFCLAHLDARGDTIAADDGDGPLCDERLRFGALGEYGDRAIAAFWYPGTEGDVLYPPMWTMGLGNAQADSPVNPFVGRGATGQTEGWIYRYHPVRDGMRQAYRLCLLVQPASTYPEAVTAAWRTVYAEYRPAAEWRDLERVERVSLALLQHQVRRDGDAIGIPTWIDCFTGREGKVQNTFGIDFVSRNLEVALVLLDAGHRLGVPSMIATGTEIVRFWVTGGGTGLSHVEYDRGTGMWVDGALEEQPRLYLRDQSESHLAVLRAYQIERRKGREQGSWLAWVGSYADWLLAHQNPDGSLYRAYTPDGEPVSRETTDGIHAVPLLLALAAQTGRVEYRESAVTLASYLWRTFHRQGDFVGGTLNNPNCYDKEACVLALEGYLALHDATGEPVWLQAAVLAARFCETWTIMWRIPMPFDEPAGRFYGDVTTVGLQLITAGFSAVDMYLSRHAADYARLARLTGDQHYDEVAEILLHNTKVMVQLGDEYGYAEPGFQIEHWAIGRGRGFGLNSGWLPWVSTSHILGIWAMARLQADQDRRGRTGT